MKIDILVLITFSTIFISSVSIPDFYLRRINAKIHSQESLNDDYHVACYKINYPKFWLKIIFEVIMVLLALFFLVFSSRYLIKFGLIVLMALVIFQVRLTLSSLNKEIKIEDGHINIYNHGQLFASYDLRLLKLVGIKSMIPGRYLSYYYLEFEDDTRLYLNPNFHDWHQLVALALAIFADKVKFDEKGAEL